MRTALAFFLCLFLAACVESEIPLSPFSVLPSGDPLLGSWVHRDDRETVFLHVGNEENGLRLIDVEFNDKGRIKSEQYEASATTLAGNHYLNVRMVNEGKVTYYIWKYRIAGETLMLWPPHPEFVENAVKDGKIAGVQKSKSLFSSVLLKADQQSLQRFLLENDDKIFPKSTSTLKRLK